MKRKAVYIALFVLVLLHHDFWLWDKAELMFGFLPVGLAYHVLYSVAVALFWYLVVNHAWPEDVEAFAEGQANEQGEDVV